MYELDKLPSPCYLIDTGLLEKNLKVLRGVRERAGCKILLALKGFAAWGVFDLINEYLDGASASGLFEAMLGREFFSGQVHTCGPAYRLEQFDRLIENSDHIVFNSHSQWRLFRDRALAAGIKCGLRINPEQREVETAIYDPCGPFSRLGITEANFDPAQLDGITGLHFHTLCELNSDALARTVKAVEEKFGEYLNTMEWVNFGGGHHITRADYDIELLCQTISSFKSKYEVEVYLEPGEAIALNTGFLIATVLDIVHNEKDIAVLDTSASAHMPDVLEMPYRPNIPGSQKPGTLENSYILAGMTCLAGDVIGEYSFDKPLKPGDKLIFEDMAHYTMVKNNMFNGINLPDIVIYDPEKDQYKIQRRFTYEDYRNRLS